MAISKYINERILREEYETRKLLRKSAKMINEAFAPVKKQENLLEEIVRDAISYIIDLSDTVEFDIDTVKNQIRELDDDWIFEKYDEAEIEATINMVAEELESAGKLEDMIYIQN